ncbi:MAG: DUF1761 domain-containing protein [Bacteroidetes bacterium]|nr:DUF1761 domain-containing protein [Bacteroidota bacterium]
MHANFMILLLAALVPTFTGFIWYNPKVLGTAWMNASGVTPEKMKGANMAVIFIVSFLLSFFLAFALQFMVIHQWGVFSSLATGLPGTKEDFADFMLKYGQNFRTFKHGALHGAMSGLMIALPIIGTNALFERKGIKYIAINAGYWIITMALMGGIICQFS